MERRSPNSINCEDLTLTYITPRTTTYAVRSVSLRIGEKSFAGIVGPSGSGKSSLLYLLSGLKTATAGDVYFGDFHFSKAPIPQQLTFRRQNFGFIFQQPFLVPYLNLLENTLVPVENPQSEDIDRAYWLLEHLGLAELAPKFPNECSGGERVRASIARGLVHRPQYLFVDEPTANLDLATGARVMKVLQMQREYGALVIVTHDLEILDDADVIFRMRDGALTDTYIPQRATA